MNTLRNLSIILAFLMAETSSAFLTQQFPPISNRGSTKGDAAVRNYLQPLHVASSTSMEVFLESSSSQPPESPIIILEDGKTVTAIGATTTSSSTTTSTSVVVDDVPTLFSEQVHRALVASHRYMAASRYARNQGYKQLASQLRLESEDERMRALKFLEFAMHHLETDLDVKDVDPDPEFTSWKSISDMAQTLLQLERMDTVLLETMRNSIVYVMGGENGTPEKFTKFMDEVVEDQMELEDVLKDILSDVIAPSPASSSSSSSVTLKP